MNQLSKNVCFAQNSKNEIWTTTLWTRLFVNYVIKTKGYSTYVRTSFSVLKDGTGAGEASREDEFPEVPGQPGEWVRRKWCRLRVQVNIKINPAVKPMNCVQICTIVMCIPY